MTTLPGTTPEYTTALAAELPGIAININDAIRLAEKSATTAMQHALRAGRELLKAKAMVPRGDWLNWVQDNIVIAPRTAQAYMRLAEKLPKMTALEAQRVADLPVRDAIRAIATAPSGPPTAKAIRVAARSDAQRASLAFRSSASALREAAKWVSLGCIDGRRVQTLRSRLAASLAELDRLTGVMP